MSNRLLIKKSSVAAKVPVPGDLEYGELAINYTDEKIYFKNASNLIKSFSSSAGTVTSVAALTLGTTGTDVTSTVATGTTTPVITLNIPTASATNRGVLSAADWTTFNNKLSSYTEADTLATVTARGATTAVAATFSGGLTGGGVIKFNALATSGGALLRVNATGTVSADATAYLSSVTASNFASQIATTVLAAPTLANGVPTFRTLTLEDIPDAWVKKSVIAATTANITLSAPQTIDGIAVVAGDRVLVKDQTLPQENGIYIVAAAAWTRALDANTISKIAGAHVNVDSGTANGGLSFDNDIKTTDTLGTTAMLWFRIIDTGYTIPVTQGGTGAITAGAALTALGAYASSNPSGYTTNVGTVTSVAALTIGTTGTDITSTVATGTTTPVITLNVPTASAANRGALSAADWTTFNNKVGSLTDTLATVTARGATTSTASSFTGGLSATGITLNGTLSINNATTPNTNTIQFGDNTGWNFRFMTSVSGTPTTRFTFNDGGNFTAVGTIGASNFSGSHSGTSSGTNTGDNPGVTSVTGTAPVVSSGGTTPAISMAAATTSVAGYLTAADWTTFNNKQPAGSYLTAEADTLATVTGRGATTSVASTFSGGLYGGASAANSLTLKSTSGNANRSGVSIGDVINSDNGGITFTVAGSSTETIAMRIQGTSANVGVGTTAPAAKLDVSSTTAGAGINITKANSTTANENGGILNFYNYAPANIARASGTIVGQLYFGASQPTSAAIQDAAAIKVIAESQSGGNTPSALAFFTSSTSTNIERLRITSNGGIALNGAANYGSSGQVLQSNGDAAPTWVAHVTSIAATTPIVTSAATGAVTLSHAASGVTAGTYNNTTVNATGHVTAGSNVAYYHSGNVPPYPAEADTLATVTARGATTALKISIGSGIAQGAPSATDVTANATLLLSGNGGNYLAFGQHTTGQAQWIQSAYSNPTTAVYPIALQPLGGNVGIGTYAPAQKLHVVSSTNYQGILVSGSAAPTIGFVQNAGTVQTWKAGISGLDGTAFSIGQGTGGTDSIIITTGNNVGIGITAPGARLDVRTSLSATAGVQNIADFYATTSAATDSTYGGRITLWTKNPNNNYWPAAIAAINDAGGSNLSSLAFYTATSGPTLNERMRLDSSGNLGIGTNAPSTLLTVASVNVNGTSDNTGLIQAYYSGTTTTVNAGITAKNYQGTSQFMQWDVYGLRVGSRIKTNTGQGQVIFTYGNDAEAMRIDGSGNLGIGTTSPLEKLQVNTGNISIYNALSTTNYLKFVSGFANNTTSYIAGNNNANWGGNLLSWVGRPGGGSGAQYGTVQSVYDDPTVGYPNQNTHLSVNVLSTTANNLGILYVGTGSIATNTRTGLYVETGAVLAATTGNVGIGSTSPSTYAKLDVYQATDPGTTPAGLSVRLQGVGGGAVVPQYGINVDASASYNNASILYGIKVLANQNVGSTTYGVHSTVSPGSSNINRWGVYGKANFNSDASHVLATLPVGVYGEAGNSTGTTNVSTSAAGYFLNSSTLGAVSYGVYIKTTAGPTSAVPLRIDHGASELLRVTSTGDTGIGTSSPAATKRLHVANVAAGSGMRVSGPTGDNNWAGGIEFYSDNTTTVTSSILANTGGMLFSYGGSERVRITTTGSVGIGVTAPASSLHIIGSAAGQTTGAITDAGSMSGIITVADSNNQLAGGGGGIVFGSGATRFAAIKGYTTGGAGSTIGDLMFSTRNATSDTALTERMRLTSGGGVSFGATGTAYGTAGQVLQSNGDAAPTWVAHVTSIAATTPIVTSAATGAITLSHATSGATAGTYNNVTVNTFGHVTAGSNAAYLTGESDTLATVTARGNVSTGNIMVPAGNGTGYCFWGDATNYKIMMSNAADAVYGPVTDYSLKLTMGAGAGRGITFGQAGVAPVAAINTTSGNMQIAGTFSALSKSFLIDHPTKPGMQLRYGSLEGPENGVYIRGRLKGNKIELPEYWTKLVDPDSITVNLTAIGKLQDIYVEDIIDNVVYVGGENVNCFYTVYAERVDVAKLEVEIG